MFQPTPAVRAAAFTLFGSLSRFGNGPSEGPFLEQIQTNFVSLLVHLNEADPTVVVVRIVALLAGSDDSFSAQWVCRLANVPSRSLDHSSSQRGSMKCFRST